mmetsp:Transcript_26619/g.34520  ORF Transcript_26619/g.34520 Transcript_26619/m.34520 type:complete len:246 (-) Transcript_26619:355-1092(-)
MMKNHSPNFISKTFMFLFFVQNLLQQAQAFQSVRISTVMKMESSFSRRSFFSAIGVGTLSTFATSLPAQSFENRIAPRKYPPQPGPAPRDLGVREGSSLKICGNAPNCFSSSADPEEDPDHYVPPFKYTKSKDDAMKDVIKAIKKYQPGENNIDGGGWEVKKLTNDYIYVQFESLKHGYIDDLEIAVQDNGNALVRSSSRIGYLDFQVNAKRINAIGQSLMRSGGWEIEPITAKSHPTYFGWNRE